MMPDIPANQLLRPLLRAAAFLLALTASPALAQSGVGVSPPRVEHLAQPGSQVTQTLTIDNPSTASALLVNAYFNDVFLAPDGSTLYVDAGSNPRSLASWTAVNPLSFTLEAATKTDVIYTIDVPEGTEAGTYWSVIFFESQPPGSDGEAPSMGVRTLVRVGHIIYVHVGQPTYEGSIASVSYDPAVNPNGAVRVTFQNSGTGLMRLDGRIEVRTLEGELVHTTTFEGKASLPGATHDLVAELTEPLESGDYVVLAVLDHGEAHVIAGEGLVEVP